MGWRSSFAKLYGKDGGGGGEIAVARCRSRSREACCCLIDCKLAPELFPLSIPPSVRFLCNESSITFRFSRPSLVVPIVLTKSPFFPAAAALRYVVRARKAGQHFFFDWLWGLGGWVRVAVQKCIVRKGVSGLFFLSSSIFVFRCSIVAFLS